MAKVIRIFSTVFFACLLLITSSSLALLPPSSPERTFHDAKEKVVHLGTQGLSTSRTVTLYAGGDIMTSRTVEDRMKALGTDYPFRAISSFLEQADIVVANLETPLVKGARVVPYQMSFRGPPQTATELSKAHISLVTLANNHMFNQGAHGIEQTITALDDAGVAHVGAGSFASSAAALAVIERNGVKLGFLGYAEDYLVPPSYRASETRGGIAVLEEPSLTNAIRAAKASVDTVIVLIHFGEEYRATATPSQQYWARRCIDAGATVAIGHHPHVLEPVERYKDGIIFYSLGNLVFDQVEPRTKQSALAMLTLDRRGVRQVGMQAITIANLAQPQLASGKDAQSILAPLTLPTNPRVFETH